MSKKSKITSLFLVYVLSFLFSFHSALPTYINSSFIGNYMTESWVGIIYIIGSLIALAGFSLMPWILKRWGNYKTAFVLILIDALALFGLSFFHDYFWVVSLFLINLVSIPLVYFSIDIFIENFSLNLTTGQIRGIYLTAVNLAWAFSPFISSLILTDNDYWKIYLVSGIMLIPTILILMLGLRRFVDPVYEVTHLWQTAKIVWKRPNLRNILMADFLLYFFYSWMIIYAPIYLHDHVGLSWKEILGVVFTVMLLPFVFIQFPLGRLADRNYGEKEILSLGFLVMAISTGSIFFLESGSVWFWAAILFMTRVGAAAVEVMCDTYFFKQVSSLDTNLISFYRLTSPLAYIVGPLAATALFAVFSLDLRYLFLILGILMLSGLRYSLSIKDTR